MNRFDSFQIFESDEPLPPKLFLFHKGNKKPTKEQVAHGRRIGDDSFLSAVSDGFIDCGPTISRSGRGCGIPSWENREPAQKPIVLKMKSVEAHDDPWVGPMLGPGFYEPRPADRRAIFWLLEGRLSIQVGLEFTTMMDGDYIVFNDSYVHSVTCSKQWIGSTWQLMP